MFDPTDPAGLIPGLFGRPAKKVAAAELFTMTDLVAWYDPSTTDGVTFAGGGSGDGDTVDTLLNLLGDTDYDFTLTGAGRTWDADGINSLGVIAFAGADEGTMDPEVLSSTDEGEIFAVVDSDQAAGSNTCLWQFCQDTVTTSMQWPRAAADDTVRIAFGTDRNYVVSLSSPLSGATLRAPHIINASKANPAAAGQFRWFVNGSSVITANNQVTEWMTNAASHFKIAADDAVGGTFIGKWGEMLIYNRVLTTAERALTLGYLADKWGITVA